MLYRAQRTILVQIFCEFMINSKVISKSILGPDDFPVSLPYRGMFFRPAGRVRGRSYSPRSSQAPEVVPFPNGIAVDEKKTSSPSNLTEKSF